jgi:hypothetical protein
MAHYGDPDARYGACYYDGYVPPIAVTVMAKIKLDLYRKTVAAIIQFGKNVHTGLTGNAYVPTPAPTPAALQTGITNAETANDAYEMEKETVKAKKLARDAAVKALADLLRAEAVTVQAATGGDPAKILTTGFEVANGPTPAGVPDQVQHLEVSASNHDGALKAVWKKTPGAQRYELQASVDPPAPTSWTLRSSATKTRADVNGFVSGVRIWLRVRAVNAAGEGPWSDPAVKTVP